MSEKPDEQDPKLKNESIDNYSIVIQHDSIVSRPLILTHSNQDVI